MARLWRLEFLEVRSVAVVVSRMVIMAKITKSDKTISISEKPFLVRKKYLRLKEGIKFIVAGYLVETM